jgi:catechol 2,3-dioxygenase-like lactoylglutathione lyase family enzyme
VKTLALERISVTVGDLAAMQAFYCEALGFEAVGPPHMADPALAKLLGAKSLFLVVLRRGGQSLELAAFDPPGDCYPPERHSNDLLFQHVALVCEDIATAYAVLSRYPHAAISRNGPQNLPGGIAAYKFRDPEGHPLELIQFPKANPDSAGGIDHSALSSADAEKSIAFYTQELGFSVASRQVNAGPAQDAMDDLDNVSADIVALAPKQATPHVELLGYRLPKGRAGAARRPADIAATRLVLRVDRLEQHIGAVYLADGSQAALIHDPDGHALLLLQS